MMLVATSIVVLAFRPALHPAGLLPAVQPAVARSAVDISMSSPGLLKKLGLAKSGRVEIYGNPNSGDWNCVNDECFTLPALHPVRLQSAIKLVVARSSVGMKKSSRRLVKKLGLAKKKSILMYATGSWAVEQGGGSPPRTPPANSNGRPEREDGPPLGPILSALALGGAGSVAVRQCGLGFGFLSSLRFGLTLVDA